MFRTLLLVCLISPLLGCATTSTGKAIDHIESDQIIEAIPHLEKGIKEGDRGSSLILALIYSKDTHVPRDIDKAQKYMDLFSDMEPTIYDQPLNYYVPYIQGVIWLEDDIADNDLDANRLLKQQKYKTFPPVLLRLAENFSYGLGVKKDYRLAHALYLKAIENSENVMSELQYIWKLAVHYDDEFRKNLDLMKFMPSEDAVEENYDFIYHDTKAAVLARMGLFSKAIESQDKAITQISRRLNVYPYYQTWKDAYLQRKQTYQKNEAWVERSSS
ncbi:MAG: hypothetical protein HWE18_04725 [Gammaproteobacteria bacterium]|nr:hypothetical protein [Gammaproteobacteria bacterium]